MAGDSSWKPQWELKSEHKLLPILTRLYIFHKVEYTVTTYMILEALITLVHTGNITQRLV